MTMQLLSEVENELNNHQLRNNYEIITKLCDKEYLTEQLIGIDEVHHHRTKKLIYDILNQEKFLQLIDVDVVQKGI